MTTEPKAAPPKPVPVPDDASRPFFEAAQRDELVVPRCPACRAHVVPGSLACTECYHPDLEWVPASGRGTLFTFGIVHKLFHPAFAADLPYNVAVVELEEGPRINTNIVGVANEDLRVGMPVTVVFEAGETGFKLPRFRPAG